MRIVGARRLLPPEEEADVVRRVAAAVRTSCSSRSAIRPGIVHRPNFGALGAKAMFGSARCRFHGRRSRAPIWVRAPGSNGLFRLMQEPGRLVRRYTIETASFLIAVSRGSGWSGAIKPFNVPSAGGAVARAVAMSPVAADSSGAG